jgi:hypothetical protein
MIAKRNVLRWAPAALLVGLLGAAPAYAEVLFQNTGNTMGWGRVFWHANMRIATTYAEADPASWGDGDPGPAGDGDAGTDAAGAEAGGGSDARAAAMAATRERAAVAPAAALETRRAAPRVLAAPS